MQVSQEPVLFAGTIADNIGYARHGNASLEEIQAASEAANAHEFIKVCLMCVLYVQA
jgi:ABC-type multidrug transport system fused ATPase/permease subunit